ncbi:MAG: hypothetical protein RI560_05670 [Natronomonas sp.]|nr:hypothetical protein [Natronomonas sp.]
MDRQGVATIALVLLVLVSQPLGGVVAQSLTTHFSSSGVTYETNNGLEVTLSDGRDIDASPFGDNDTWTSGNVTLSSPGAAEATVSDQTFDGTAMSVLSMDATQNAITASRSDGINTMTFDGGATNVIMHDVTLDDGNVDLTLVAGSTTNVTVQGVPDVDGIQAVDQNGNVVAGDTDTDGGVAELTFEAGTYDLRLQDGPSTLEIRAIDTQELVTQDSQGNAINVEVEFFGNEGAVEQRNTTTGVIDMTGLPADERFSVTVDAGDAYVQRQIIIPSLLEQQTAFLLNQSVTVETVEPRFTLSDPSNQFDEENSEIIFERPIDRGNGTEFFAVAGDRVGINGYDAILERDQRYRVIVRDPQSGQERRVGEFTPTQSEQITLEVEDIEFNSVSEVDGLEWTARYVEKESNPDEIEFIFRDEFETQSLTWQIYERGNKSNVLASGSASGNVTATETVPPSGEDTVWVVEWDSTRANGDVLNATRPVSTDRLPVGPASFPDQWQIIVSMLVLFGVAGLFGAANPGIGGIAVSATGGMLWMIGWLPDGTGGLMVVLALFISVLSYTARRARGATV